MCIHTDLFYCRPQSGYNYCENTTKNNVVLAEGSIFVDILAITKNNKRTFSTSLQSYIIKKDAYSNVYGILINFKVRLGLLNG